VNQLNKAKIMWIEVGVKGLTDQRSLSILSIEIREHL
jgi:hypothetical protein